MSQTAHPAELGVGVVGAGRVGTALAAALRRSGHRIVAVSAVSAASLRPGGGAAARHAGPAARRTSRPAPTWSC